MPSALSAKIEKQSSSEVVIDNSTPIRQVLVVVEHKIRNLEKRKNKLDSYRDLAKSGKDLSSDQRQAVAKYDEVAQSLELARELSKQIHGIALVTEKEHKKQLKKEAAIKFQQETFKVSQSILLQTILTEILTVSDVRNDFLNGTNGALKLETSEIELLDKYYNEISLSRPFEIDDGIMHNVAEHIMSVVDGRPKVFGDTTYEFIYGLIEKIYTCGYFGKKQATTISEESSIQSTNDEEQEIMINGEEIKNIDTGIMQNEENCVQQQQQVVVHHQLNQEQVQQPEMIVVASAVVPIVTAQQCEVIPQSNFTEAPAAAAVPAPTFPTSSQNAALIQQTPPVIIPPPPGVVAQAVGIPPNCAVHIPPTTVRAVEQGYFKQHQYIQQMRPLTEVIGTGKFFFLQDSELDSPDIMPGGFQNMPQVPPPTVQQQSQPPQHNPQASPSPLAVVQQSVPPQTVQVATPVVPPPQGVVQSTGPPNIPTHTFSNQNFPNIVPSNQLFGNMKGNEINPPNPHIPAFVQANPAIALAPSVTSSGSVHQQQGQTVTGQQSELVHIIFSGGQQQQQQQQQQFQPNQSSPMPMISQQQPQAQDTMEKSIDHHQQVPAQSVHIVQNQKIQSNNEWNKPTSQEVRQHHLHQQHIEESNEWTNPNSDIKEWNNDCVNDNMQSMENSSNTWNSQSSDNGYGGSRGYRGRGGRDGGGPRSIRGNGTSNGYRSRPNTYPQNNGSARSNGGGGGGGGGGGNAFYRNNSDNYYQNTNGSGGGGGNSYNNSKSDNYQGNGNGGYKTRGAPSGPERNPLRGPPRTQTGNTNNPNIGAGPDKNAHIVIRAPQTNRDPRSITGGSNAGNGSSGINTRPARGGAPSGPPLGSAYGGPRGAVASSPRSQQQPLNT